MSNPSLSLPDQQSGSSKVDILICTPGRLIDHLNSTPNFSLQHLRYLVIDEADRLLAQSFHEWNARVLSSLRPSSGPPQGVASNSHGDLGHPDAVAPHNLHVLPYALNLPFAMEKKHSSCQKLLFSATLTRDPGQLATLELRNPQYFIVHGEQSSPSQQNNILDAVTEKFSMPASLSEYMIISETAKKPLMFFHLLRTQQVSNALVFTKSAESTGRLLRLLDFFEELLLKQNMKTAPERLIASAYSSDLGVGERKTILEKFKAQKINLLVCSDLVSRGIDIKHVSHVISYDAPVDMRKYVHRVGRTARAGRVGEAWTLVEEQEARYFKNMLQQSNHLSQVKRLRVKEKDVSALEPLYKTALDSLRDHYAK
jgi:ATP-dependent RNA helicase DDX51/DBP6